MTAAMLSLGERISLELSRGALNELYIRGQEGYVLVNAVGEDAVLTVMTREEAKLGLIFLEMRRAASDLEKNISLIDYICTLKDSMSCLFFIIIS